MTRARKSDAVLTDDVEPTLTDDGDGDDVVVTTVPAPHGEIVVAVPRDAKGRLDAVVAAQAPGLSRTRITELTDAGWVSVDGVVVRKASHKLCGGERVTLDVPAPQPTTLVAEDLPLTLVYDDDDCCVLDKAAGMVVHPGAGHAHGTIANALLWRFPQLSVGGERRPGIVHRLDKDTSGLLVVAKHDRALANLQAQFVARTVSKRYVAVCLGRPADVGVPVVYDTGHARHPKDRRRFVTKLQADAPGARRAITELVVRGIRDGASVVDVTLHTGRTHQIRAHLADRGHPLCQDALYGGEHAERRLSEGLVREAVRALKRQALHAATLAFQQPTTGAAISLTSPLPADLAAVVDAVMRP